MTSRGLPLMFALLLAVSCTSMKPIPTGFLDRAVTIDGITYPYVIFIPRDWSPARTWPVVLFLHGAGERGHDGLRPSQVGLGSAIRFSPERVPAIIVFPQAPPEERWIGPPADAAMMALEQAITDFRGDRDRVSLTGMSMGGFGTWHLALTHPHKFAALVPVCGGIVPNGTATSVRQSPLTTNSADPYAYTAEQLRHIPAWIFHGAKDDVILPTESRAMHDALRAAGASDVRYTEYKDANHNSWDRAYGEEALWKWLFAQRRPAD